MDHTSATCSFIAKEYGVVPTKSWGDVPEGPLREWWDSNGCNEVLLKTAAAPQAAPQGGLVTTAYIGSWSLMSREDLLRRCDRVCWAFWGLDKEGRVTGRKNVQEQMLKALGPKILASLGGWGNCAEFSRLFADSKSRAYVVANVGAAIGAAGFSGLDLDWEFPSDKGDPQNLLAFLREFKAAHPHLLVTIAGSSSAPEYYKDIASELATVVDCVHIMTYDFVGQWTFYSGFNSDLAASKRSVESYRTLGFPAHKLMIGSAWYGRQCTVTTMQNLGIGQQAVAWEDLQYREIAAKLGEKGWIRTWIPERNSPWLYNSTARQVITYEDKDAIRSKRAWALKEGLGGIFCWQWAQDTDDGVLARALLGDY